MGDMTNYFIPQGEQIDLSQANSAADIVFELSTIIEEEKYRNKKIKILLGNTTLNQSQLLSIKSLIESVNSEMVAISTNSATTELAALNTGIIVANLGYFQDEIVEEKELQETVNIQESKPTEDYREEAFQEQPEQISTQAETQYNTVQEDYDFEKALENILEEDIQTQNPEIDELEKAETLYIKRTLRSGQTVSFDGNVVVIGDAHPGSEIIATGDISVWGVLSGIAHAGAKGNESASIRALKLNAIQLRIAGYFARRPDAGEVIFSHKDGGFRPEEAKITNGMVTIYTTTI